MLGVAAGEEHRAQPRQVACGQLARSASIVRRKARSTRPISCSPIQRATSTGTATAREGRARRLRPSGGEQVEDREIELQRGMVGEAVMLRDGEPVGRPVDERAAQV